MLKRLIGILMSMVLLLCVALPVLATEQTPESTAPRTLKISSAAEFLTFAESCRLDSYSKELTVTLENDIDLGGTEFAAIPIFFGSFDGKGNTISGVSITADGSAQGLFRYVTSGALVKDLTVEGQIQPAGSRSTVGGIAGHNDGQIINCVFSGGVSGGDCVGGLVGINGVTGIVENCRADGVVHGDHFAGGIAGDNRGVIRECSNNALVNATPQQNSVDISNITMDTLTNTEAANTVTDIGGIAGISSGVIRSSKNFGSVGYQHMGYNIGGIAGTQSGYIADCENLGNIRGRKEVGGIVGQMEPVTMIEFSQDTLQILQGQLNDLSGMINQVSGNAQSNAGKVTGQIGVLQEQAQTAYDAVDTLIPNVQDPQLPDPDAILAAQNTLSSTLGAMPGTLSGITSSTQNTVSSLLQDLRRISSQMHAMEQTINSATENLGGSIADCSDEDTAEMLSGKVECCVNRGAVLADLNIGGIAGAVAVENDLDILEDWQQLGEESLNFQSKVRAVILDCQNYGTVTGVKQNAGGIAGWQSLGLVKGSTNVGKLDCAGADYVGGISGMSTGFIRSSFTKCQIHASANAGGVAGSATIATDCLAQVMLLGIKEKQGAILGTAGQTDEEAPISGNYYLCVDEDHGAIDGISYAGLAEGMALDAFMGIDSLPDVFRAVTVRFVFENGEIVEHTVAPGAELPLDSIPAVPQKDGSTGIWEGLEVAQLTNVLFDMTFTATYNAYASTAESTETRENGRPVLLLEGSFTDKATVTVAKSDATPSLKKGEILLEAWTVTVGEDVTTARFLLPADASADGVKLLVCGTDGSWRDVSFDCDGSYLVFSVAQGDTQLALVQLPAGYTLWLVAGIGAVVLLLIAGVFAVRKKRMDNQKTAP